MLFYHHLVEIIDGDLIYLTMELLYPSEMCRIFYLTITKIDAEIL